MPVPELRCDLVMKGGITSGVVYPSAVVELAEKYRFDNIGGASAGAIAAVVTAAAEYGRETGGFKRVAALPDEFSGLGDMFQPHPRLRPLFEAVRALLAGRKAAALPILLAGYWRASLIGAAPGVAVFLIAAWCCAVGFALLGVLLAVFGAVAGAVVATIRTVRRDLPDADYGLCGGLTQPGAKRPALTDWLADTIDKVAGRDTGGPPLGVADLAEREIRVQTVTTDLMTHRPYALPIRNNLHFFSRSEFLKIFPKRVVDRMVELSNPVPEAGGRDLHYFQIENMPLVVLARVSLSFPLLIAAVPLWRMDHTLTEAGESDRLVRCLFSDGGLSSNFPVHFFDTFLPHTPTFGISLGRFDARRARPGSAEGGRVVLPVEAFEGKLLPTHGFSGLGGFLWALFDSAKDWQDSLQSVLTGYRERIVTVNLNEDEGGLNLDMPDATIADLSRLGTAAGREIVSKFHSDEHRWRRYLVELRAVDAMLRRFAENHERTPTPGDMPYGKLAVDHVAGSYTKLTKTQRRAIRKRAEMISRLGAELEALEPPLEKMDAYPRTASRLRTLADMES
jgi:predicted acylesterase/phospholipase RssA